MSKDAFEEKEVNQTSKHCGNSRKAQYPNLAFLIKRMERQEMGRGRGGSERIEMGSGTLSLPQPLTSPPLNDRPSINVRCHCNVCSDIGVSGKFRNFIPQSSLNLAHISRKRKVKLHTCATNGREQHWI